MMPATARGLGLRISGDFDGRLDFGAATGDAALDLIERLAKVFERDRSLVTMVDSAGDYRIRNAVAQAQQSGRSARPEHLAVNPITHQHQGRLSAVVCIAQFPERVGMILPDIEPMQAHSPIMVPRSATLVGVGAAQWVRWNPAWRRGLVEAGTRILLPLALRKRAETTLIEQRAITVTLPPTRIDVVQCGETA